MKTVFLSILSCLLSYQCFATETINEIEGKYYLSPGSVYVAPDAIYVNINGNLIQVSKIASDSRGVYIEDYECYYTPWHDDDWQCERGHWSPRYENKCVTCGKAKTNPSLRWKDQH